MKILNTQFLLLLILSSSYCISNVYSQEKDDKQKTNNNSGKEKTSAEMLEEAYLRYSAGDLEKENKLKTCLNTEYSSAINNVSIRKNDIVISGYLASDTPGFLVDLPMHEDVIALQKPERLIPLSSGKSGFFKIVVKRVIPLNGGEYDRLLSKWVIVNKKDNEYKLLSHVHYGDSVTSAFDWPELKLKSKKGLAGFAKGRGPVSDLDDLNISSATVNIRVASLLRAKPGTGNMPFKYNGKNYYVNIPAIQGLDSSLQILSGKNISVAGIVLIDKAENCPDKEIGKIFQHPGYNAEGKYSMANVTSSIGMEYYGAIMDFLAHRYSLPDRRYGHIDHWIIHNEINAGWVWTNMGDVPSLVFMNDYQKSMRTVFYLARKYNPHSRVFISLTHYWTLIRLPRFYQGSELLDILLNYSKKEGDFDWAIAFHPYPQNLFNPKSWLDKKVDFTFQTPMITFRNIEVINAWVEQPYTLYRGKSVRPIWFSEQGLNSIDYSENRLTEQAAGMAYAWKKVENLKNVQGFQYHNWADTKKEGGLRIGLRRSPEDSLSPLGIKPIWEVYKAAGTVNEEQAFRFAQKIIGINNWDEIIYKEKIVSGKENKID